MAGELADLYHPQVARKVANCEVNLFGNTYYDRDLTEWHGQTVFVAYDIHDPKRVHVRDEDQRLICMAKLDGNKSDYFPMSFVEQAREKRAAGRLRRLELKVDEVNAELEGSRGEVRAVRIDHAAASPRIAVDREALQRMEAEKKGMVPADDRGKWRLWVELEKLEKAGEPVPPEFAQFYKGFRGTRTWAAFDKIERELGGRDE